MHKNKDGLYSVGDFAKISRTTLATLHHYDKLGLLSPEVRGENKYRFYSIRQVAMMNMIRTLHKLEVPLAKIKTLKDRRSPERAVEVMSSQIEVIDRKMAELAESRKLLTSLLDTIRTGIEADTEEITLEELPASPIMLGEINDYSGGRDGYDALFSFYDQMYERHSDTDLIYPVWGVFSAERIARGDWRGPDRYFFYSQEGNAERPGGLYAVGYTRAGYGQGKALYPRMMEFIRQKGLTPHGDAYEEYPLNEICVADASDYLMRVLIPVR